MRSTNNEILVDTTSVKRIIVYRILTHAASTGKVINKSIYLFNTMAIVNRI